MRILLIYAEEDTDAPARIEPFLRHLDLAAELVPLKPPEDKDTKRQFSVFLEAADLERKSGADAHTPTYLFILSALDQKWLDFLAGFSCGSSLPFLVYGGEAIEAIPVEFSSYFRPLKSESALNDYLQTEFEAFETWTSAHNVIKARDTLLRLGISVTGEALVDAVSGGDIQHVSLFLAAGFSPDTRNKTGVPLLHIAARKGQKAILRLLLHADAQINLQADDRGTSALLDSVMGKQHVMVDDLIRAGADLNIKSKDGQTALIVAVGAGDEKIVEMLLKAGADPDIADNMGVSARNYVSLFRREAIVNLFNILVPRKTE